MPRTWTRPVDTAWLSVALLLVGASLAGQQWEAIDRRLLEVLCRQGLWRQGVGFLAGLVSGPSRIADGDLSRAASDAPGAI